MTDALIFIAVCLIIALIFLFYSREARRSVSTAKSSEKSLEEQRDTLERHVSDRTEQLMLSEKGRLEEVERVAQFGRLSQGLFHDLMNPLSALSMQIEALLNSSRFDPKDAKDMLEKAVTSSKRMRTFMDSVKKCLGTGSAAKVQANIYEEICTAKDILAYKARTEGIIFDIAVPDELKKAVLPIHPVRLHQVFLNLLSNALDSFGKTSRQKRVTVEVSHSGGKIIMTVRDNGSGMTEDQLNMAFKSKFTTKPAGTGLGLLTVKDIIEELHGNILIRSKLREGTRFTITI